MNKPSKTKKVLVLTDDMPWGHRSIARAIFGYLKDRTKDRKYEVRYAEVKAEMGALNDLYTFFYRYLPYTNRWTYRLMRHKQLRELFEESSRVNLPRLKGLIAKYKPDLIICCYFFHGHSLAKWRKKENLEWKLWTVVSDPWTINSGTIVRDSDLCLTYDEVGKKVAKSVGVPEDRILETGWWVRPEMYKKYDRETARRKLGFRDDRRVIFVGGGSLGNNALTRLLPILMLINKRVGFVFNTGVDRVGFKMVEQFVRLMKRMGRSDLVEIKNLGWIDNMAEVLAGCDLVLGKAGPNFLFDVAAAGKPFVAITHVGGQEDGNIELIRKKKLGWVKEKSRLLAKFLNNYLEKPQYYEQKYEKTIAKEAERNQKSLETIYDRIMKDVVR